MNDCSAIQEMRLDVDLGCFPGMVTAVTDGGNGRKE